MYKFEKIHHGENLYTINNFITTVSTDIFKYVPPSLRQSD